MEDWAFERGVQCFFDIDNNNSANTPDLFNGLASDVHPSHVINYIATPSTNIKRRHHTRLIRGSSIIQHGAISLVVRPDQFEPTPLWAPISTIEGIVKDIALLPEAFDTLEEEYHDGDIDEEDNGMESDTEDDKMIG